MKKSWPITLLVCLLILGGGGLILGWPRTVPLDQCSDVYRKYACNDGIDATFIKDYKVDDTVSIDVTLLVATTDSAWTLLCDGFCISDVVSSLQMIGEDIVFTRQVNMDDYTQVVEGDSSDAELLSIAYFKKAITIFHVRTEGEKHAVLYHNLDESTNQQKNI